MNYTKGEWKNVGREQYNGYAGYCITLDKRFSIDDIAIIPTHYKNAEANANLIAAAPDMYRELRAADNELCYKCKDKCESHEEFCSPHLSRMKAINKAEGEDNENQIT